MIVEEVKMPPGKTTYLGKRIVHALRVERTPSLKESVLVAERAMVGAAS